MNRITQIFLTTLPALLTSCGGGGSSGSGDSLQQVDNGNQIELTGLSRLEDFGEPNRSLNNSLETVSTLAADGSYRSSFDTDATANYKILANPGMITLTTDGVAIIVPPIDSESMSQQNWEIDLEAGSWEMRYDPDNVNTGSPPLSFMTFTDSRYTLYDEVSSRLLQSSKELLFRASIVSGAGIGDVDAVDYFGQQQIPEQATIVATLTFFSFLNGEWVHTYLNVPLLDTGDVNNGDAIAGDGLYSSIFTLTEPGGYFSELSVDAIVNGSPVQRNTVLRIGGLSEFRVQLASGTTEAVTDQMFDPQVSAQGDFIIPVPMEFTSAQIPQRMNGYAELWATNNNGEQVLITDTVGTRDIEIEARGDGTYIFPMFLSGFNTPDPTGQHTDFHLRNISLEGADLGFRMLLGTREIQVTGLPW